MSLGDQTQGGRKPAQHAPTAPYIEWIHNIRKNTMSENEKTKKSLQEIY